MPPGNLFLYKVRAFALLILIGNYIPTRFLMVKYDQKREESEEKRRL